MSSSNGQPAAGSAIVHNETAQRFETTREGHLCMLEYSLTQGLANFHHTAVPAAVGGRGIAAELTQAALETARARGWRVQPTCSYVAAYLRRHPEYQDLIA